MVPSGSGLVSAEAHVVHRGATVVIVDAEVRDPDGRRAGIGRATGLVGRWAQSPNDIRHPTSDIRTEAHR